MAALLTPRSKIPFPFCSPSSSSLPSRFRPLSPTTLSSSNRKSLSAAMATISQVEQEGFMFGPYKIGMGEVFFITKYSYAFVNLKPVVPDVLVSSKRIVPRLVDLTDDETIDLWITAKHVGSKLEPRYGARSLTFGIQDGAQAGQTVPHVHVHVLPRKVDDLQKSSDKADTLDEESQLKKRLDAEAQRKDRTREEMLEEATELRKLF